MNLSRRGFIATTVASTAIAGRARPPAAPLKTGHLGKYVGGLAPGRYDAHTHVYPGEPDPGWPGVGRGQTPLTENC